MPSQGRREPTGRRLWSRLSLAGREGPGEEGRRTSARVEALLREAEAEQERLAALLRLAIFAALLLAWMSIGADALYGDALLAVTLGYGGFAALALVLAWRCIFHPALPFAFVTLEVLLVVTQALLATMASRMSAMLVVTMPVAGLIYVILAHAAMRYRPWLVVYAAGLFVAATAVGRTLLGVSERGGRMFAQDGIQAVFHFGAIPLLVIVLTSGILFISNWRTRRLLRNSIRAQVHLTRLARFFAPELAGRLANAPDDPLMRGERRELAVVFADVRGFTGLSESMPPEEVSLLLADFRALLAQVVRERGGVVDKFIGDAVMAVFGISGDPAVAAEEALRCSRALLDALARWSAEREARGDPGLRIGIGVHFGEAFVGIIGKESLLEFTVIGDTVNVAERLERLTRSLDASVAVSESVYRAVERPEEIADWRLAEGCLLAGRRRPLNVYYARV